jgi:hypothetical protein
MPRFRQYWKNSKGLLNFGKGLRCSSCLGTGTNQHPIRCSIMTMPCNKEALVVPTHPSPVMSSTRRSSLTDVMTQRSHTSVHKSMVLPLMSSTLSVGENAYDATTKHIRLHSSIRRNGSVDESYKIDPVAIAVAANAKRQQEQDEQRANHNNNCNNNNNNSNSGGIPNHRRGSLDVHVEYAVAMVNIVNPIYDMDDRDMCPFGTRRDSVCGGGSGSGSGIGNHNKTSNCNTKTTGTETSRKNESPSRTRRRILKKDHAETNQSVYLDNNIRTGYENNNDGKTNTVVATP